MMSVSEFTVLPQIKCSNISIMTNITTSQIDFSCLWNRGHSWAHLSLTGGSRRQNPATHWKHHQNFNIWGWMAHYAFWNSIQTATWQFITGKNIKWHLEALQVVKGILELVFKTFATILPLQNSTARRTRREGLHSGQAVNTNVFRPCTDLQLIHKTATFSRAGQSQNSGAFFFPYFLGVSNITWFRQHIS